MPRYLATPVPDKNVIYTKWLAKPSLPPMIRSVEYRNTGPIGFVHYRHFDIMFKELSREEVMMQIATAGGGNDSTCSTGF